MDEAVHDAHKDLRSVPGAETARRAAEHSGSNATRGSVAQPSDNAQLAAFLPRNELPDRPKHWQRMRLPWARRERALMRLVSAALALKLQENKTHSVLSLPQDARSDAVRLAQQEESYAYSRACHAHRLEKVKADFAELVATAERKLRTDRKSGNATAPSPTATVSTTAPSMQPNSTGLAECTQEEEVQAGVADAGGCNEDTANVGSCSISEQLELLHQATNVRSGWAKDLLARAAEHRATVGALWSPYLPKPDSIEWGDASIPLPHRYGKSHANNDGSAEKGNDDVHAGATVAQRAEVQRKVGAFVGACLQPFKEAALLDERQFEQVKQRCIAKVMKKHQSDTTADFLTREGDKVRQLVSEHVKRIRDTGVQKKRSAG